MYVGVHVPLGRESKRRHRHRGHRHHRKKKERGSEEGKDDGRESPTYGRKRTHPKCLNAPIYYQTPHHFFFFSSLQFLSTLQLMFTLLRAFNCVYSSLTGHASDNKQKPLQSTIAGSSRFLLNSGILGEHVLNSTLNFYRYSLVVMKLVV